MIFINLKRYAFVKEKFEVTKSLLIILQGSLSMIYDHVSLVSRCQFPMACFSRLFTLLSLVWQQLLSSQPFFVSTHSLRGSSVLSGLPLHNPFSMLPFGTFNVCLLPQLSMLPSLPLVSISGCIILNLPGQSVTVNTLAWVYNYNFWIESCATSRN